MTLRLVSIAAGVKKRMETSYRSVEIHPVHPWVRNSPFKGNALIGEDCWNKIVSEGIVKPIPHPFKSIID